MHTRATMHTIYANYYSKELFKHGNYGVKPSQKKEIERHRCINLIPTHLNQSTGRTCLLMFVNEEEVWIEDRRRRSSGLHV